MTVQLALDWFRHLLWTALLVGGPVVLVCVAVGLVVAVAQAATQINDSAVAFAPKIIAVMAALSLSGSFMLNQLTEFATAAFTAIGRLHP